MPPSRSNALIVVRMNYLAPTELVPIWQGIEILLWGAEICQGVRADVGKSSTTIGRPCEGRHALNDSQRTRCFVIGFRRDIGCCRHWPTLSGAHVPSRSPPPSLSLSSICRIRQIMPQPSPTAVTRHPMEIHVCPSCVRQGGYRAVPPAIDVGRCPTRCVDGGKA